MKKTYWWRVILFIVSIVAIAISYYGPCEHNLNKCFYGNYILVTRTIFHMSLALLLLGIVLFFVSDNVFIKWFRFALIWLLLMAVLVSVVPVSTGGWMNFGPTKYMVSIWMVSLFVILSLAKIIWDSTRQNKIEAQ